MDRANTRYVFHALYGICVCRWTVRDISQPADVRCIHISTSLQLQACRPSAICLIVLAIVQGHKDFIADGHTTLVLESRVWDLGNVHVICL